MAYQHPDFFSYSNYQRSGDGHHDYYDVTLARDMAGHYGGDRFDAFSISDDGTMMARRGQTDYYMGRNRGTAGLIPTQSRYNQSGAGQSGRSSYGGAYGSDMGSSYGSAMSNYDQNLTAGLVPTQSRYRQSGAGQSGSGSHGSSYGQSGYGASSYGQSSYGQSGYGASSPRSRSSRSSRRSSSGSQGSSYGGQYGSAYGSGSYQGGNYQAYGSCAARNAGADSYRAGGCGMNPRYY